MNALPVRFTTPAELRERLKAGDELAFLDVREEGPHSRAQPLFAVNLPLSRLELRILDLVPRKTVPVALFDDGEGYAARAVHRLADLGYTDLTVVVGGLAGWTQAGGELFRDVNVPSKSFGEWVAAHRHTPVISALELKALQDGGADVVVLDARPFHEYQAMTIPGSIDCPGAELVLRAREAAPDPKTLVVVNCAGRTRSIIGAQSLINAGLPNTVCALENGTIGWTLAGLEVETGARRRAPAPSDWVQDWARKAARHVATKAGVRFISHLDLARFEAEAHLHTLFRFDVRLPEEHLAGRSSRFANAPGGQLVQATDEYVGVRGARIVLADDDGVRAAMTGSWLRQLGWDEVYVLEPGLASILDAKGPPAPNVPPVEGVVPEIPAATLSRALEEGLASVVDLAISPAHARGHIPGAWFLTRARLDRDLSSIPCGHIVLTSPDGLLARQAWREATAATTRSISVLAGGTQAWAAAGFALETGLDQAASPVDDVYKRPYEGTNNSADAMQAYIDWELELVAQITRDGTANFRPIS